MPKTKISEYSTTNSSNTDIEGINIDEGCAPSGINNAIRELMVHLKEFQTGASGDAFTFAGGTLMSGTNTISGAAVISGNINSSGTTNTFSGGNILSGTNTISGSAIISGNINSSGTTNTFSGGNVFSGTNTFSGTNVFSSNVTLNAQSDLRFADSDSSNWVAFQSPATVASNVTWTLPAADGTSNQVLATNGSGTLSWTTAGGGASISAGDSKVEVTDTGSDGTIVFNTDGSERMRVNASGNVGIGTTNPSVKFQVEGTVPEVNFVSYSDTNNYGVTHRFQTAKGSSASPTVVVSGGELLTLIAQGYTGSAFGSAASIRVQVDGTPGSGDMPGRIVFYTSPDGSASDTERVRITSGGEVYIAGTTDQGAYNLQCNGTGVWGAGAYVNGSDERIKEEIAPIESGLDVVEKLNPVTYRYKEDWSKDQSTQTGFIAQELLVAMEGKNYVDGVIQQGGSEGYYSVAYQNIIPILTKAIQELKAELDTANTRLATLEAN